MIKSKKGMMVMLILGLIIIAFIAVIFIGGISMRTAEKAFTMANESLAEEEGFGPVISDELFGKTLFFKSASDLDELAKAAIECYEKCEKGTFGEVSKFFFCNYIDNEGRKEIKISQLKEKIDEISEDEDGDFIETQIESYSKNFEMCCANDVDILQSHIVVISDIGMCFSQITKEYTGLIEEIWGLDYKEPRDPR